MRELAEKIHNSALLAAVSTNRIANEMSYLKANTETLMNVANDIVQMSDEIRRLKEALLFYANPDNINFKTKKEFGKAESEEESIFNDFGTKAREVLNWDK